MPDPLRILREKKISLEQARELLGTDDRPVHFVTVWRAATRGVIAPDGTRIPLETLKLAGRLVTSVEAIERFIAASNGLCIADVEAAPETASGKRRAKELARVDAELLAAGI
jgi:hypothetical protein